ncbi:MAG: phenylalanine--tRNA ligase subunit beta [Selenomonadaceae bacterium]|nr:phenylalanine--tRNA ligase subunit beta [Selenomonadaceae bacterium]
MQVSTKWLKDYINIDITPEELAEKFTMAGVPVENVIHADEGLEKVVTGKIEKLELHPDSDHLQVCQMNVGTSELLQIVTGAPNVKQGQVVPVALVGAHLPNGQKISKGKLRGVASNGMLCSAQELNLDLEGLPEEQKTGIYILPDDTPIGVPAKEVLGLDDVVLEFELTANRGDCFSVFGLVREAAVLTDKEPTFPDIKVNEDDNDNAADLITIKIDAPDLCSRFSSRMLKNVKLGPSPEWMQQRLQGAGIRAINNVVDVTNFVMVELGQPMHAYDYDEVAGHVLNARRAAEGEQLHTLDDSNRLAKGGELVIADAEKAAGLAGVMGGFETEITNKTKTVVLEAACFNSASIRRTARSVGLHSEASGRFERGTDVTNTIRALDRAAQLLQDMGACTVCKGIVDNYPSPKPEVTVEFTPEQINARLGTDIKPNIMADILTKLGFVVSNKGDVYTVKVPSWRNDVTLPEDISEEIARITGFDKVPSTLPIGETSQGHQSDMQNFVDKIKSVLTSLGMNEELSFSFTNPTMFDKMNVPQDSELRKAVPIMNPLTDDYPLLRTTLLASIMENVARNYSRKNEDVRLFEIAPVFYPKALPITEQPIETLKLAGLIMGRRELKGWNQGNDEVDFYDLKGIIEELFKQIAIEKYTVEIGESFAMHPGKTAVFKKGKDILVTIGELHPAIANAFDIPKKMYVFEADVATLLKYTAKGFHYEQLPKYPAISRDLAVLVDKSIAAGEVEKTITKTGGKFFDKVTLFDVYTGERIGADKKSLAFNIKFQSNDRTLTDAEADEAFTKILSAVEKQFNATLRS